MTAAPHLLKPLLRPHLALCVPLALLVGLPLPAQAVIIDAVNGDQNISAPPDDPGWIHVCRRGGISGVYLGHGWMLTAAHGGAGNTVCNNTLYPPIPGSEVSIIHSGSIEADLELYRIDPHPALPELPIRPIGPSNGNALTMIGRGRDRGDAFSFWNPPSEDDGYLWKDTTFKTIRWGTNVVSTSSTTVAGGPYQTDSFIALFDRNTGDDECHVADGDSGGATFIKRSGSWELAGLIIGINQEPGQPVESSLYTNPIFIADLSHYRTQILDVITPVCGNGYLTADEDCDDGNTLDGDCCSSTCQFEIAGSACDDGVFCTGDDQCDGAGACSPGSANPCDDGLFCNGDETCNEGSMDCSPGTPPDPDDGVPCTLDSCDEDLDAIINAPDHGACDDADVCTNDVCDPLLDCQYTPEISAVCGTAVPGAGIAGQAILFASLASIGALVLAQATSSSRRGA